MSSSSIGEDNDFKHKCLNESGIKVWWWWD